MAFFHFSNEIYPGWHSGETRYTAPVGKLARKLKEAVE
jgi:hypothetical protein